MKWSQAMTACFAGLATSALAAEHLDYAKLPAVWDLVATPRVGGGYKDNVLLSSVDPQASPFLSAGAELLVLRMAPEGPQWRFFVDGEWSHFFDTQPPHDEATLFTQAEVERDLGERWKVSLAGEYFYQDQAVDVSVSETNRQAEVVRGNTLTLRPGARVELPHRLWLAIELSATRQIYATDLDDYWEPACELALGRHLGANSDLSLGYLPSWWLYDTDEARTANGDPIPGTRREDERHELRLRWKQDWDAQGRWRSTTTVSARKNLENGGGYATYDRLAAMGRVRFRHAGWEFSAEGRIANYDYLNQTVSETDLDKRHRLEWSIGAGVERQLGRHLRLTLNYEHEATLSNDSLEAYTVNTVQVGARWEL